MMEDDGLVQVGPPRRHLTSESSLQLLQGPEQEHVCLTQQKISNREAVSKGIMCLPYSKAPISLPIK